MMLHITLAKLISLTGLTREEVKQEVRSGRLKKPVPLGPWSTGWESQSVESWLQSRALKRGKSYKVKEDKES